MWALAVQLSFIQFVLPCAFWPELFLDITLFRSSRNFTSQVVGWVGSSFMFGEIFSIYPPRFHSRPVLRLRPHAGNQTSSKLMSVTPMFGKKQLNPLAARVLILHVSHLCRRLACWSFNVHVFCVLCLRLGMAWINIVSGGMLPSGINYSSHQNHADLTCWSNLASNPISKFQIEKWVQLPCYHRLGWFGDRCIFDFHGDIWYFILTRYIKIIE